MTQQQQTKQQTRRAVARLEQAVPDVLQTVLERTVQPEVFDLAGFQHRESVIDLSGSDARGTAMPATMREDLEKAGFHWFIARAFAARFPFSVGVCELHDRDRRAYTGVRLPPADDQRLGRCILFTGEIPPMALARTNTAQDLGLSYVTVHSAEPLPFVELAGTEERKPLQLFQRIDPILIGWAGDPRLQWGPGVGTTLQPLSAPAHGVVIAAWDLDKEISVL